MNLNKLVLSCCSAVFAVTALPAVSADLEASANIGVSSDYVWRGVTQTGNESAVSGGIDLAHSSGFYVGTWASNVSGGHEVDLYAGFSGETAELGYDIGFIYYGYTDSANADFSELSASLSYNILTLGASYTLSGEADGDTAQFVDEDLYYYASAEVELPLELSLGVTVGAYSFANDSSTNDVNYGHYQLDLGKSGGDLGDFTMSFSKAEKQAGNPNGEDTLVVISWSKDI